ncbi:MAG: Ankyrin repeats (3 copies) [Candidatus Dependentiae bacterium ADurb.Bin331]|nr:MAG: Ankyrin repeats (3 copies) [Candidatus Dependentiae bacterium ADurb.Bin331]
MRKKIMIFICLLAQQGLHGMEKARQDNGKKLIDALETKDLAQVLRLLNEDDRAIDITVKNQQGATVLHLAVDSYGDDKTNFPKILDLIFKRQSGDRPDVDVLDNKQGTPLNDAINRSFVPAVEDLLSRGADPKKVIPNLLTPLEFAEQIATNRKTADAQAVYDIIKNRAEGRPAPVPVPVPVDRTPNQNALDLINAIQNKNMNEIAKFLVLPKGKINGKYTAGRSGTILIYYVENIAPTAKYPTIKLFMDTLVKNQGADINQPNNQGKTPLMAAVIAQSVDAAKYLVDAGADLDKKATDGEYKDMNALQIAQKIANGELNQIVDLLQKKLPQPGPKPGPEVGLQPLVSSMQKLLNQLTQLTAILVK